MSTLSLAQFGDHLASRRAAILQAWRQASLADPVLTTVNALTREQFHDHIPQVLDALQRKLRSREGGASAAAAEQAIASEEAKHGLQRWQQGYRQEELAREWGLLHLCLVQELENFAGTGSGWSAADQWRATRELVQVVNDGVAESARQYAQLQQAEALGRAHDLEISLTQLRQLERRRAQLIHQVVHDLRGNVQSVGSIADLLSSPDVPEPERIEFATLLQNGVEAVSSMLGDLIELARLEAGQEQRTIKTLDVAQVLSELCELNRPRAEARKLYLRWSGPSPLRLEGDANKVRRLLQNLLINALKYTEKGGVEVSWGLEPMHWWLIVKDTGPGLLSGPGAPLAEGLRDATASAREADERNAAAVGKTSNVLDQADAGSSHSGPSRQQAGEGVGLSIVKRLCELLDASLELISSTESGTTLRVVFPLTYMQPPTEKK